VPLTPEQTTYFRAGHAHAGVRLRVFLSAGALLVSFATVATGIGLLMA
jgi:hypothetical protein